MHFGNSSPIVYALLAIVIVLTLWRAWAAYRSKDWPTTIGRVLSARIVKKVNHHPYDGSGQELVGSLEYYEIELRYEYSVKGARYSGARLSFNDDRFTSYDDAIDALAGISAGQSVKVYYDPAHPHDAVLSPGVKIRASPNFDS